MITIALGSFLIGAVLGTRFRVQVLLVGVLGLMVIVPVGFLKGFGISSVCIAAITYSISLQVGYLFGLFARSSLVAVRSALHRSRHPKVART